MSAAFDLLRWGKRGDAHAPHQQREEHLGVEPRRDGFVEVVRQAVEAAERLPSLEGHLDVKSRICVLGTGSADGRGVDRHDLVPGPECWIRRRRVDHRGAAGLRHHGDRLPKGRSAPGRGAGSTAADRLRSGSSRSRTASVPASVHRQARETQAAGACRSSPARRHVQSCIPHRRRFRTWRSHSGWSKKVANSDAARGSHEKLWRAHAH